MSTMKYYPATISSKSRAVTAFLAIVLGWLGAHRFYIGKTRSARLMLYCAVGGLFIIVLLGFIGINAYMLLSIVWIWAAIDFIIVILGMAKDIEGKPIKKW